MRGYEAERDKLREHLGIEWIPGGLKQNAYSDDKFIRHSCDLNCNFDDVKKCRWKNMEDKWGLDSLDFHLFEKVDFTEFPALRVLPGPTKIHQGDKMIFTGDKKREEQHALYISSQIGCQNSTGNLTFTYWSYNSAQVEVVLFEDLPNKGYKMLYEKPYVDCGTLKLNTECRAEIPPRKTPFRIAFRAYDMSNPEGSFIMLDNFIYTASLCKVGIDMGDDFSSVPLESIASGKPIRTASDLDCRDFYSCRWRAFGRASKPWQMSSSILPLQLIFNATGSYIRPEGTYALLYIEQDNKEPLDYLRSDPISCQSQTENTLSLRFWMTKDVLLEACALSLMDEVIECHVLPSEMSPAPVSTSFTTAAKNFVITIRVRSFNPDFDSVVIVDDISYRATLCSDALNVFDLGEHFVSTPLLSLLLNKNVNSAKELSCDFARRAANCVWGSTESTRSSEENEIFANQWMIGHGPLNQEKLYSLTGFTNLPDGEFAVARMETGGSTMLLSEVIRCALDDVSIQFSLWLTGTAKLQVCLVDESTPLLLDCQPASSGPVVVDLPRIERPFRIALRAESPDQGMVIVDDISVQGHLCPSVLRQHSSKSYHPLADQPDPNACRLLSCDFKHGHTCLYESSQIQNSIIHGSAVSRLDTFHGISILESPTFHLNTISRLHFNYTMEGEALLFVCNDSANKELESCFKVEGREGEDYIEMLPSDTKVNCLRFLREPGWSVPVALQRVIFFPNKSGTNFLTP
ncbi:unnamed protein product [Angiostrongylus costaricensis]|uniref:MAM domain-containing protein n=1 Tax=Angiostrongylus costaricensis TaxID=334426 RepID=A0A158PG18_ANGCS|nr:unnamed protein product [Angiostrongylus costaricensis]